jgi:RNA polymerase sigma-70 factor, ECF subfamily
MEYSEQLLIEGIKEGRIKTFEELYKNYYIFLCLIAEHIIRNRSDAEEIVSDVFIKLWNNRNIDINSSVKGYLIKAVRNTAINYLQKQKNAKQLTDNIDHLDAESLFWDHNYPLGKLFEQEITGILQKGIALLPEGCREIFLLSRSRELTYNDIANELGISVNTVKSQMKIALSRLRVVLKDYLNIILLLLGL